VRIKLKRLKTIGKVSPKTSQRKGNTKTEALAHVRIKLKRLKTIGKVSPKTSYDSKKIL
jgi:hypothetical protein